MNYNLRIVALILTCASFHNATLPAHGYNPNPDRDPLTGLNLSEDERESNLRFLKATCEAVEFKNRYAIVAVVAPLLPLIISMVKNYWSEDGTKQMIEQKLKMNDFALEQAQLEFEAKKKKLQSEDPTQQMIEQKMKINDLALEQAQLELEAKRKKLKVEDIMNNLALKNHALSLQEKETKLKIVDIVTSLAQKEANGEELADKEKKLYEVFKNALQTLAPKVDPQKAAEAA